MFLFKDEADLTFDSEYLFFKHKKFIDYTEYFTCIPRREVEVTKLGLEVFAASTSQLIANGVEIELDQRNATTKINGIISDQWIFSIPVNPTRVVLQNTYKLLDNYIAVLRPHTEFSLFQRPFANRINIHVSKEVLNQMCQTLHLPDPHAFLQMENQVIPVFHCAPGRIDLLRTACLELYRIAFNLNSQLCELATHASKVRYVKRAMEDEIVAQLILILVEAMAIIPKRVLKKQSSILANAEEFMRNNVKTELTTKSICDDLNVSQRNLEYIFKEFYGISPKNYFKRLRLNAMKQDLEHRSRSKKITDIAHEYGFFHRGRLAEDYQKLFGELPSETLGMGKVFTSPSTVNTWW